MKKIFSSFALIFAMMLSLAPATVSAEEFVRIYNKKNNYAGHTEGIRTYLRDKYRGHREDYRIYIRDKYVAHIEDYRIYQRDKYIGHFEDNRIYKRDKFMGYVDTKRDQKISQNMMSAATLLLLLDNAGKEVQ